MSVDSRQFEIEKKINCTLFKAKMKSKKSVGSGSTWQCYVPALGISKLMLDHHMMAAGGRPPHGSFMISQHRLKQLEVAVTSRTPPGEYVLQCTVNVTTLMITVVPFHRKLVRC